MRRAKVAGGNERERTQSSRFDGNLPPKKINFLFFYEFFVKFLLLRPLIIIETF